MSRRSSLSVAGSLTSLGHATPKLFDCCTKIYGTTLCSLIILGLLDSVIVEQNRIFVDDTYWFFLLFSTSCLILPSIVFGLNNLNFTVCGIHLISMKGYYYVFSALLIPNILLLAIKDAFPCFLGGQELILLSYILELIYSGDKTGIWNINHNSIFNLCQCFGYILFYSTLLEGSYFHKNNLALAFSIMIMLISSTGIVFKLKGWSTHLTLNSHEKKFTIVLCSIYLFVQFFSVISWFSFGQRDWVQMRTDELMLHSILYTSAFVVIVVFSIIKHVEETVEALAIAFHESRRKDAFVRQMAHEIRSPLNVCMVGIEMMQEDLKGIQNVDPR